jgi:hypothetical protein
VNAFDYSRPLAAANRMIERYGQLGAILFPDVPEEGDFDPEPGEPDSQPARFVIVGFDAKEIDGTRVLATDKKALVAPGSLTLAPDNTGQLVEADGTPWNIVAVDTLRPAETTLLWTLQIRR